MNNKLLRSLIGSILTEAQELSPKGITVTVLVKFLYLADVYYAEHEGHGKTLTGIDWIFYKFGPYSHALRKELDKLVVSNVLLESEVEDKELRLLRLNSGIREKKLESIDLPFYVVSNLRNKIKKYTFDLSGLLDYVYFRTTPMQNVTPGQDLSFDSCAKTPISAYKPIKLKEPSDKIKKRIQELSNDMESSFLKETKTFTFATPPLYDETFYSVIESSPCSENPNMVLDATLSFDK